MVTFQLIHIHNYNLSDLENMIPWERDIYLSQIIAFVKNENEKIKLAGMQSKNKSRYG